jgi:hypothetical protein
MDFIKQNFEAIITFIITSISFLGVIYAKFSRIEKLELKLELLEQNIKDNFYARLDRIEAKIDNFLTNNNRQ